MQRRSPLADDPIPATVSSAVPAKDQTPWTLTRSRSGKHVMVLPKVVIDTSSHDEVLAMRNDEFKRRLRQLVREELSRMDLTAIVHEALVSMDIQTLVYEVLLTEFHMTSSSTDQSSAVLH